MWASDYPHFDCTFPGVGEKLQESCKFLPEGAQRKIMGENTARCYGLVWPITEAEIAVSMQEPNSLKVSQ